MLEDILKETFIDYSSFVLQRRAIADVRDLLKYTARQILHAQYREKLTMNHPFKKSQKSVSAATAFSYVHGDSSAYGQIIRMGRPLVQRYYLEDIKGNGGTPIDSKDYAAFRYTECRTSPLTSQMFETIETGAITDWAPTYDEEGVFPLVLPSIGYYNICNGSFGSIGVGLISSIPQFNLKEVNDAIISLIYDPNIDINLLPDFASGGILLNPKTTLSSLSRGEGKSALLRGHIKKYDKYLEVISLPYGVYTSTVCAELEKNLNKGDCPFSEFKDLSKRDVRIRIYSDDLDELEKWLYKNSSVQNHFTIKLIMLNKGKTPKLFTIKEALLAHIDHVSIVWRRALEFNLSQLKARTEIIEGLLKGYSILDEVIVTIKSSQGRADAINKLIIQFGFTKNQAEAIVDLRLHRLSAIDIQALKNELEENLKSQTDIQETLNIKEKFNQQLIEKYKEVSRKFSDKRRTEIFNSEDFETAQEGSKTTEEFWIDWSAAEYNATNNIVTVDNSDDYIMNIKPKDKIIIVTNHVRGFIRYGSDFFLGENIDWNQVIKLNPDEKVLFIAHEKDLHLFNFVQLTDDTKKTWSLHMSFILTGAGPRGKRLVKGKYNIIKYFLDNGINIHPRMQ